MINKNKEKFSPYLPDSWLLSLVISFLLLFVWEYLRIIYGFKLFDPGFGVVALGFVVCFILNCFYFIKILIARSWVRDPMFVVFLLSFFVIVFLLPIYARDRLQEYFLKYFNIALSYALMCLIGIRLSDVNLRKKYHIYFFAFLFGFYFFALNFVPDGEYVAFFLLGGSSVTHHAYAASILFVAMFSVLFLEKKWMIIFFIASGIVLIINGSRADFLGLVVFVFFYIPGVIKRSLIIFGLLFLMIIFNYAGLIPDRFLEMLDLGVSPSYLARQKLQDYGMTVIANNIFWGDIGYQIYIDKYGSYMHNILSIWSQYGVLAFLCFVILMMRPVCFFYRYRYFEIAKFGFAFGIAMIFLISSAKSFVWTYPAIYWGFYLGVRSNFIRSRKNASHRNNYFTCSIAS